MKVREKVVIGYVATSFTFILLTSIAFFLFGMPEFLSTAAIITFLIWGAALSIVWLALLYVFVTQKIEYIEHFILGINRKNAFSERLVKEGDDEFASISEEFNKILELAEASSDRLELRIKARTLKLEKRLDQLEKEISDHEYVKKNLLTHNKNLIHMSHHDPLTSLPNRILFNETLSQTIVSSKRQNKVSALLIIRFDNFKNVNETLGYATGDLVLKELAKRMKAMIREVDMLARLGGAEFGILLMDIVHTEFASVVAEKIISISAELIKINKIIVHADVNIGIALSPQDGSSLEQLLKNVDDALYQAKRNGNGTYQFFTKNMGLEASKLGKFEGAMQGALKNKEFFLNFQPIVNLQEGKIISAEALIRWESPVLGIMKPGRFIPLAEKTGFIMELGEWVLRAACLKNKAWQDQGFPAIPIAVNLSSDQFKHQDLVVLVKTILEETKLDPSYLELEIKSSTIMENFESSIRILTALGALGVRAVISEFGSGATSISGLKKLPVYAIKIDQNFITDIPDNQHNVDVTQAIISFAHSLGLKTIAAGIETNEQLKSLINERCDLGQGYLFSKPLLDVDFVASYFTSTATSDVSEQKQESSL